MKPLEDNIYRVIVAGINSNNGDYWELSFHYLVVDTLPGTRDAFEVAKELAEQWALIRLPGLAPLLASNVTVNSVSARRADATGGPMATEIVSAGGEATSVCETVGNGAQIAWFGGVDPILIGRTYIPGIPNDSLDDGNWDVAYIAVVESFIEAMLDSLDLFDEEAAASFYVTSRQISVESQKVEHGLLRAIPGTQRRRLRR